MQVVENLNWSFANLKIRQRVRNLEPGNFCGNSSDRSRTLRLQALKSLFFRSQSESYFSSHRRKKVVPMSKP